MKRFAASRRGTKTAKHSGLRIALTVAMGCALGVGCNDDPTGPELSQTAILEVWLDLTGDMTDPDGMTVAVAGHLPQAISPGEMLQFAGMQTGTHVVTLADVETFCRVHSENPQSVVLGPDQTVTLRFAVTCGDPAPDVHLAGMEVLGSGYDVTGNYADVADVRAQVLDLTRLHGLGYLRQVQYERATYDVVSGKTSREYQNNLSWRVEVEGKGRAKGNTFSGAVKASWDIDRYESREYSFASVRSVIRKHGLRVALHVAPEDLRDFLTEPAATALNDPATDPEALFETFGTHVLRGIILGGRLDFNTSANMSFDKEDRTIDVYARASFKNLFNSASIEAQRTQDLSWSEYSASEEKHLEVYGGRSEYGQYIMNDEVYRDWIESVEGSPVFMDFETAGLLGIWELADDPGRRAELESAWEAYAEARGITLRETGSIRSDFEDDTEEWLRYGGDPADYAPPLWEVQDGYFGSYIYLRDTPGVRERFVAPGKFVGDKTVYAGGVLRFHMWLKYEDGGGLSPRDIVQLLSENGNLYYRSSTYPPQNGNPQPYVIPLTAGVHDGSDGSTPGSWIRWNETEASDADIFVALAQVRAIQITGEFINGMEEVALDRVALEPPESES